MGPPKMPDADPAQPYVKVCGSTPAERLMVWSFGNNGNSYLDFDCVLLDGMYDTGGLTLCLKWHGSLLGGQMFWMAALRRLAVDAEDIDGAHTYSYRQWACTAGSVIGEVSYEEIDLDVGALDNVAAGDKFILRVRRNSDHASDTYGGIAYLHAESLYFKEAA